MEHTTARSKSGTTELVSFMLGDEEYGIHILQVKEIIRAAHPTHMPNTPEFVEGVINLRGTVIPIIDLKKRFRIGAIEKDNLTRVIIVDVAGRSVGLEVDNVHEVVRVPTENIDEAPTVISSDIDRRYISGIAKMDDRLIILLDIENIFSSNEAETLKQIQETEE